MSDFSDYDEEGGICGGENPEDPKKHAREQHNALERRRRDNIKDMYQSLREVVPEANSERASRAMILKKAIETIQNGQAENEKLTSEVEELNEQNEKLKKEIEKLKAKKQQSGKN